MVKNSFINRVWKVFLVKCDFIENILVDKFFLGVLGPPFELRALEERPCVLFSAWPCRADEL